MEEGERVVPWEAHGGADGELALGLGMGQVHEEDSEDQVWSSRKTELH